MNELINLWPAYSTFVFSTAGHSPSSRLGLPAPPSIETPPRPVPAVPLFSWPKNASCSRIPPQASCASLPPRRWATTSCRHSLRPCTTPLSCSLQPLLKMSLLSLSSSLLQFVSIVSLLMNHGNQIFETVCVFFHLILVCLSFLIEMNFSFKPLFAIWSLSPQWFHYYFYLSVVSWQYQKHSTILKVVLCLLCVTPLFCSSYSSFAPSSPFFSSWWQKDFVVFTSTLVLECSLSMSSREPQTTHVFADSRIALLCHALRICVAHAPTECCLFPLLVHWTLSTSLRTLCFHFAVTWSLPSTCHMSMALVHTSRTGICNDHGRISEVNTPRGRGIRAKICHGRTGLGTSGRRGLLGYELHRTHDRDQGQNRIYPPLMGRGTPRETTGREKTTETRKRKVLSSTCI